MEFTIGRSVESLNDDQKVALEALRIGKEIYKELHSLQRLASEGVPRDLRFEAKERMKRLKKRMKDLSRSAIHDLLRDGCDEAVAFLPHSGRIASWPGELGVPITKFEWYLFELRRQIEEK